MMPETVPQGSFDFLGGVIGYIRHLADSPSFNNLIYFLWALFFAIFAYTLYVVFLSIEQQKRQSKEYFAYYSQDRQKDNKLPSTKRGASRWKDVMEHIRSENDADWKVAILEADSMLGELIEGLGYEGENLGERLKNVPKGEMMSLDDAWNAHKMRNRIAHEGMSVKLSRADLSDTMASFEHVFREFDYI